MGNSMNYFVAGLPRSRTAWLSVFLSISGRFCHHEGFNGCYSLDEYKNKIGNGGDSSTGFGLIDIQSIYPNAPVLVIEKSEQEIKRCIDWCESTYGYKAEDDIYALRENLNKIEGERVKQSDIDNKLEFIWEYLIGFPMPSYLKHLSSLNVQAYPFNTDYEAARSLFNGIQQDL